MMNSVTTEEELNWRAEPDEDDLEEAQKDFEEAEEVEQMRDFFIKLIDNLVDPTRRHHIIDFLRKILDVFTMEDEVLGEATPPRKSLKEEQKDFEAEEVETKGYAPRIEKPSHNIQPSNQCQGTTAKGARCKRVVKSPNSYCHQHGGRSPP